MVLVNRKVVSARPANQYTESETTAVTVITGDVGSIWKCADLRMQDAYAYASAPCSLTTLRAGLSPRSPSNCACRK